MIKITFYLFKMLTSIIEKEECGFILGKYDYYDEIVFCKNISNIEDHFKIGIKDKLRLIFWLMKRDYNQYILFHVHDKNNLPSFEDIIHRKINEKIAIIYKGHIHFYLIKKNSEDNKILEKVELQVV